uniref:Uncharacterized protein n=1 Tax=viral metagenome TaxID=1070528 RepID=A0A6M3KVV5_9ZZZZ
MIKVCGNPECKNEFDAIRSSAKYCSTRCRVQMGRVSVTDKVLSVTENGEKILSVTKKVSKGFDDSYSPDYDLSEEGYVRRNRNWLDFSEGFKERIREGAIRIKKNTQIELENLRMMREGSWVNPLLNTKLAPKR